MFTHGKLVLAGACAAIVMAVATGSASAGRLSLSHGELVRIVFNPIRSQIAGIDAAECPLTIEASFHRSTFNKVIGSLLGYVTIAEVGACRTGSMTILRETLPWHIQYGGFNEILPTPRPILNLIGMSFRVRNLFECLARTSFSEPAKTIVDPTYEASGNGVVPRIFADTGARIECPGVGRLSLEGASIVTEIPIGQRNVLLRLI